MNSEIQENYEGEQDEIAVVVNIDEGPQTLVGSLELAGATSFSRETLLRRLSAVPDQPYSEANVAADRDAITYYYYNHGFPDVQFEAAATAAPGDPQRMNVVYKIVEGQRVFVDRVLITGLEFTRPYVVASRCASGRRPVKPEPHGGVAATVVRPWAVQRSLRWPCKTPTGIEPSKDVLFNLQEAKRWTFRYGGGIEFATGNIPTTNNPQGNTGVSPNGVLEVTRLNMFGRGQTLTMRVRAGLLTRRALIRYDAPRLFHRESWRVNFTAFYDNTADVNTFSFGTAGRLGAGGAKIQADDYPAVPDDLPTSKSRSQ